MGNEHRLYKIFFPDKELKKEQNTKLQTKKEGERDNACMSISRTY